MDGAKPDVLSDAQLDRELEAALGVDPSPEFLARVRTCIASEPEPAVWRRGVVSAFRRTSVEPMWAAGIVGIVLAIVVPQVMRDEARRPGQVAITVAESPRTIEEAPPARRVKTSAFAAVVAILVGTTRNFHATLSVRGWKQTLSSHAW